MSLFDNVWKDLKYEFNYGSMVTKIILFCIAVFVIERLLALPFHLFEKTDTIPIFIRDWFYLPSSFIDLLKAPWTLITYNFFHADILHIFFNLLVFYIFGRIIYDLLGNAKVLPIFIMGGIAGGLLYIVCYNVFPVFSSVVSESRLVGASAGVMAIMVAAATLRPDYVIRLILLGDIKIKYIAVFFILLDLITIPDDNPGGHIAHLGGALFGYLFIVQLYKGNDWAKSFNHLTDRIAALFTGRPQPKRFKQNKTQSKVVNMNERRRDNRGKQAKTTSNQHSKQEYLDQILDKIKENGYDNLTKEEMDFLNEFSKED